MSIKPIRYLEHIRQMLRCKGNRYVCPFCGFRSDRFIPFGSDSEASEKHHIVGGGRRPVACAKCGSYDRERLVYVYLKDVAHIFDGREKSILHIAPEPRIEKEIARHPYIDYQCGDLLTCGYSYPRSVRKMDVCSLPQEDDTFDIVICNHVLEHIKDDRRAMKEILRVVKPGGFAILQVPISYGISNTLDDAAVDDPKERLRLYGQSDHFRLYGPDYVERLCECGFTMEIADIAAEYPQFALNPEEKLFIAHKPS